MLRELAYAVEAMTADAPLILGIEDIHWSDPSTLDWLASVAARPEHAKLLIVVTLRPPASGETGTPLAVLRDTLRTKQLATEIALEGLDEASVARYVIDRLPPSPGRSADIERLSRRIRRHTGGNPLFLANVLDQLIDRGVVRQTPTGWSTYADVETSDLGIPATIRPVIERQLESLPSADRTILETASVVGETFPIGVVAAAADDVDADELAAMLSAPSLRRYLRAVEPGVSPDGLVGPMLAFAHTLYRDVLYEGIPFPRRADLHGRVGSFLERVWGDDAVQIAAELALHFERGGDRDRAIHHLTLAAENARRRSAFREARAHYERALELLGRSPDDDRRATTELQLRIGLGAAAMALSGFGSRTSRPRTHGRGVSATGSAMPAASPRCSGCGSSTGVAAIWRPPMTWPASFGHCRTALTMGCASRRSTRRGRPRSRWGGWKRPSMTPAPASPCTTSIGMRRWPRRSAATMPAYARGCSRHVR